MGKNKEQIKNPSLKDTTEEEKTNELQLLHERIRFLEEDLRQTEREHIREKEWLKKYFSRFALLMLIVGFILGLLVGVLISVR